MPLKQNSKWRNGLKGKVLSIEDIVTVGRYPDHISGIDWHYPCRSTKHTSIVLFGTAIGFWKYKFFATSYIGLTSKQ